MYVCMCLCRASAVVSEVFSSDVQDLSLQRVSHFLAQGSDLGLNRERVVLATGPPGKSLSAALSISFPDCFQYVQTQQVSLGDRVSQDLPN